MTESFLKRLYGSIKRLIRYTTIEWEIVRCSIFLLIPQVLFVCLTLLITIVGIRTYIYTWSWEHNVAITIIEVTLNFVIVIDYIRNLIDAPVKCEFVMSMSFLLSPLPVDTASSISRQAFR